MSDVPSSAAKSRRRPRRAKPIRSRKAHFNAVVDGEEFRFQWDPAIGAVIVRKKHARQCRVLSAGKLVEASEPVGLLDEERPAPHPDLFTEGVVAIRLANAKLTDEAGAKGV